jgi:hypothetical protein
MCSGTTFLVPVSGAGLCCLIVAPAAFDLAGTESGDDAGTGSAATRTMLQG